MKISKIDIPVLKIIIKDITLPTKKFIIRITKEDSHVFGEEINLDNSTSSNIKILCENVKNSNDIICKYIWIYLVY